MKCCYKMLLWTWSSWIKAKMTEEGPQVFFSKFRFLDFTIFSCSLIDAVVIGTRKNDRIPPHHFVSYLQNMIFQLVTSFQVSSSDRTWEADYSTDGPATKNLLRNLNFLEKIRSETKNIRPKTPHFSFSFFFIKILIWCKIYLTFVLLNSNHLFISRNIVIFFRNFGLVLQKNQQKW